MLGNQEKDKNELIASKAKLKVKELNERTIYGLYFFACDFLLGRHFYTEDLYSIIR
jgi:hypothetical protein